MIFINVYVQINDTDVVVLVIAFMPGFLKINAGAQVIAICGLGTHKYCISINVIAESIILERCKELLFLHALSGPDYMSWLLELMVSGPGRTRDCSFRRLSKLVIEKKGN